MSSTPEGTGPQSVDTDEHVFHEDQSGYHKGLGPRQLQMIAIGGAIGTGLFLGAGGRLAVAGPSLALIYLVCGLIGYLILRALGELVVHRPSSGSFVSYAREFFGEKAAFFSGWMYWLFWATTAVVDATAIAVYVQWFGRYSDFVASIPQWVTALVVVVIVVAMNLISVKVFGEMEFWFSLIKVVALVIFLVVGVIMVFTGTPNNQPSGLSLFTGDDQGLLHAFFPKGIMPALVITQGVVFAYAAIELVGTTSGETKDAEKVIPKAINTVIARIAVFYVGSVILLCLLLPYTSYSGDESPFVTFFDSIGVSVAGPIMQLVVITAALSSLNAGMYSTGRIIHSMAVAGSAPKFAQRMTKSGVPFGGIVLTSFIAIIGVVLNFLFPGQVFEIVLNFASIGIICAWGMITVSHMRYRQLANQGKYTRPGYRMPFAPVSNWLVLAFLVGVIVLMGFDYPIGTWTLASSLVLIPVLVIGWFAVRKRVMEVAAVRDGFTGVTPVSAQRPGVDAYKSTQK